MSLNLLLCFISGCDGSSLPSPICALIPPPYNFPELTGGMKIGPQGHGGDGTGGIIVHDRSTGRPMFLTNCHVVDPKFNDNGSTPLCNMPGDAILGQNALFRGTGPANEEIIGPVIRATRSGIGRDGSDWALVLLGHSRFPGYNTDIEKISGTIGDIISPRDGMPIYKVNNVSLTRELEFANIQSLTSTQITLDTGLGWGTMGNSGSVLIENETPEKHPVGLYRAYDPGSERNKADRLDYILGPSLADAIFYNPKLNPVSLFRFRNSTKPVFLYTANFLEIGVVGPIATVWQADDAAMGAVLTKDPQDENNFSMLYRFVNPITDDHVYTTARNELDGTGYCYQGVTGYIPNAQILGKTTRLYRYRNSSNGFHFYTIYPSEVAGLTEWEEDGPGYWVFAKHGPPDPPSVWPGPADSIIQIDSSCSSATLTINGKSGQTTISGEMRATITPDCKDALCGFTIKELVLNGSDFLLDGTSITNIEAFAREDVLAIWNIDNTFSIGPGKFPTAVRFSINGQPAGVTASNDVSNVYGTIRRDYTNFSLAGEFSGNGATLSLGLCGHVVASPPSAVISQLGSTQCTSPSGANVAFTSVDSTDPDNDIVKRQWSIDNTVISDNSVSINPLLALGSHTIMLTVSDSRGAWRSAVQTVQVTDSTPPNLLVNLEQSCLFPPNHKMALFQIQRNLQVTTSDVCDPTPEIRIVNVSSNQEAIAAGSGSGATLVDYKFGPTSACLRAERNGSSNTERTYTLTLESRDRSDNRTLRDVVVTVPHDASPDQRCGIKPSIVVDDNDARCIQ